MLTQFSKSFTPVASVCYFQIIVIIVFLVLIELIYVYSNMNMIFFPHIYAYICVCVCVYCCEPGIILVLAIIDSNNDSYVFHPLHFPRG